MKKIKENITMWLSAIAVIFYPCIFMYSQNVNEGSFAEIFPAFGKFALTMAILILLSWVVCRKISKAILFSEIVMLFFMNFNSIFDAIHKVAPMMKKIYLLGAVVIIYAFLLFLIAKKLKDAKLICSIFGLVFGILIVINIVTAVPSVVRKVTGHGSELDWAIAEQKFTKEKPNVYYFVYDEFGGFENMEHYYEYDNAKLIQFLDEQAINYSRSSANTESVYTSTILPNLLNLSYVSVEDEYTTSNLEKTKDALMYQMFRNNGYDINLINHIGVLYPHGCNVLNDDGEGADTLSTFIIQKSIINDLETKIQAWQMEQNAEQVVTYAIRTQATMELMEHATDYVGNKPTLTVTYIQCPHQPFIFSEEGDIRPEEDRDNWAMKELYLNQYKYMIQNVEQVILNIKENDPDALIIIQSDHGARYAMWLHDDFGVNTYNSEEETPYMQNILNLVYYKGQYFDIEGKSGINTLRSIFNEVLGTDLEELEAPEGYTVDLED